MLTRLPPEIRLRILRYPLIKDKPIYIIRPQGISVRPELQLLSILLISRQIAHEASEVLYGQNRFRFSDATTVLTFFEVIGPVNSSLITWLSFKLLVWDEVWEDRKFEAALSILAQDAKHLRTLEITVCPDIFANLDKTKIVVKAVEQIQGLHKLDFRCSPIYSKMVKVVIASEEYVQVCDAIRRMYRDGSGTWQR